jgi:hypothetical protein
LLETPAYFPKIFGGNKSALLPEDTKSRTIIINMVPPPLGVTVEEVLDGPALVAVRSQIDEWAQCSEILEALKNVKRPNSEFLRLRNLQVWRGLLAIGEIEGSAWYQRALDAARFFVVTQIPDKGLGHKILRTIRLIYRRGDYLLRKEGIDETGVHTNYLLPLLHSMDIPEWVDAIKLSQFLRTYDNDIKPKGLKIRGKNLNGYEWHTFERAWTDFIIPSEEVEIEQEMGLWPDKVDKVDTVDGIGW